MAQENIHDHIRTVLAQANRIVVSSHIRPDGDAVGSMLAMAQALREQGKQVQTVLQDRIDPKFLGLIGADNIQQKIETPYDFLIVVDSADRERVGNVLNGIEKVDLVIDHHVSHKNFGEVDFVEGDSEATALVLYDSMPLWGLPLSTSSMECLMTGILADTIGFRTSNTSAESLRAVADMMDKGVNLATCYYQTLSVRSIEELHYWALGLNKINFEDGLVWAALSLEDREKSGYGFSDDADLINHLSAMRGAVLAIVFVEQPGGSVKISWRSVPGIDVSVLAGLFGGGGHVAAAGADVRGELPEIMHAVLSQSKTYIQNKDIIKLRSTV